MSDQKTEQKPDHEKRIREALEDCLDRIEKSEFWWMDCPDRGGFDAETIRAILALRPQAVPMTDMRVLQSYRSSPIVHNADPLTWFEAGVRSAEAHHRITAPTGGEG